ncbi:hypothetical protein KL86PLE_10191 [uncultured Pleomorphomonas sp.]|uniref:Uncharacterized protein n=1 Tax=uncultured Pleomorphomonas sp. TaxID=442121 RepID=A0A212KYZ4_9HYPH|nr:hypothetical protein KL86PLE_10191 [uncultured Pleomorphomonas sp.]
MGRHQGRHRPHGRVCQHVRRDQEARRGDAGQDRRRLEPLHRPDRRSGRQGALRGRRRRAGRRPPGHELVRQGRRRQAAAVSIGRFSAFSLARGRLRAALSLFEGCPSSCRKYWHFDLATRLALVGFVALDYGQLRMDASCLVVGLGAVRNEVPDPTC